MHFEKLKQSIDIFINRIQFTKESADSESVVRAQMPYTPIVQQISQSGYGTGRCVSPFDDVIIDSIDELFVQTNSLLQEDGRHYIYTYWSDPDHLMHEYGCYHPKVTQVIEEIDQKLADFSNLLGPDDIVLVTADHGLVNGIPDFFEDHPELDNMLRIPPSVEPRAAALYVKEEHLTEFPAAFKKAFGDHYLLMSQSEALESGLFGNGPYREELPSLIGDYFAVSVGPYALYQKRDHCHLIGMHAGLTEAEMNVPLIVLKSNVGTEK